MSSPLPSTPASPVPATTPPPPAANISAVLMDFPDAARAIIGGARVTKVEWRSEREYAYFARPAGLMLHFADGRPDARWLVSEGDLIGTDWYVIPQ